MSNISQPIDTDVTPLGRLTSFGIDKESPHKALLIAPNRYEDLRQCYTSLAMGNLEEGETLLVSGYVSKPTRFDPLRNRSKLQIRLRDSGDYLDVMAFGTAEKLPQQWRQPNALVYMLGKLVRKADGFTMMFDPKPIDPAVVGAAMGVYPQKKGVIGSEKVRERITAHITPEHMRQLMADLKTQLAPFRLHDLLSAWAQQHQQPKVADTNLAKIIYRMHYPVNPRQGELAKRVLADLDALAIILAAEQERPTSGVFKRVQHSPAALTRRIKQMGLTPTDEQLTAANEALAEMASGQPMHRLLSGDVGTGKTIVLALVAAAVADAGGSVGIMMPNSDLVTQVADDIDAWWPDIKTERVTGNQKAGGAQESAIKIGTTALLHRYGDWRPTLTIVDEQQKYSIDQRQQLARDGGHLLESTATCMPRTAAQITYGLVTQSRLTKPHIPKTIHTKLYDASAENDRRDLFKGLMETLSSDGQTLVVFAARDEREAVRSDKTGGAFATETEQQGNTSPKVVPLETGFTTWANAAQEGQVVALHGKMKAKARAASLEAIKSGKAKVLCATISAEVGLNIPNLKQVIIYNGERFGLTQLHQLRGRVARLGGEGRCDLFVDKKSLSESALKRLQALCDISDGFRLAEMDMELRGIGDLVSQSNRQSGATAGRILINHKPTLEHFNSAQGLLDELQEKTLQTAKNKPDVVAEAAPAQQTKYVSRPPQPSM